MIKNLGVTGSVVGEKYVGGIIGGDNGTIEHCYYKGTVTGKKYVGGIVGSKYVGDIINCYCTGKISGTEDVGGITGYNGDTVKNCYSVAEVSGNTNIGGAIGKNSSIYKEVSNCYYLDGSVTKGNDSGIGTAKTEADFNSGEVAWALQNGQTDKAVQVWGQTVNETDNTKNDKYPVFTSEADKKVYKVAQTANTPIGGEYTENSAVYSNDNQTLTLNGYKGAYTNRFYGWAKEKDSRVLITEYAISKPTQRFTAYGTS